MNTLRLIGITLIALAVAYFTKPAISDAKQIWRGLVVEPENRCAPYKKKDYPHKASVEKKLLTNGKVYLPYTKRTLKSIKQTDIEHIVATNEAHDSGLCKADKAIKKQFANDLRNLTLAGPKVNRHQKSGKDAGDWLPDENKCWFVGRVLEVKNVYNLSVDKKEKKAMEKVLKGCDNFDLELK